MRERSFASVAGYTPAMLEAIVFDFDGIIVDTEPLHYRAFLEVMRSMGVEFDYQTYLQEYIGFDDRDAFRHAAASVGRTLDHTELARLVSQKEQVFERIAAGVQAFPGAVELIQEAAATMPIAIASGALKSDIALILPHLGDGRVAQLFTAIVTANDVPRSKPDPQSYALAVQRLGRDAEACLAIEDTTAGLASARGAGLQTLGVGHSYPVAKLTAHADRVVDALAGVTLRELRAWFG